MDVISAISATALLAAVTAISYHTVRVFTTKGKSFTDYKNSYPECVGFNRVNCYQCNHNQLVLKRIGYNLISIINSHICQHCGTELYRSKTRV
jgi:ribosomal protein S27E